MQVTRQPTSINKGCTAPSIKRSLNMHGQTVIRDDSDFTSMLAIQGLASPSLILLRSSDHLSPQGQAALLIANLPAVINDLEAGSVVSLSPGHLRVRALSIQR